MSEHDGNGDHAGDGRQAAEIDYAAEIDELRARVDRLEQTLRAVATWTQSTLEGPAR